MTENETKMLGRFKSQAEVARAMNLTRASVNRWFKNGRVPANRVREYCKKAGIKPAVANSKVFS